MALADNLIALQGLAEVGTSHDFEIVAPYLEDARRRARALAVAATGRLLDTTRSRPIMLAKLDDPSPSVVRTAGRVLSCQGLDGTTLDDLWRRATAGNTDALRRAASTVFAQQSRWPRLVFACRSVAFDNDDLQRRGTLMLEATLASWNNAFTEPTSAQRTELHQLEAIVGRHVSKRTERELGGLLAQYPA